MILSQKMLHWYDRHARELPWRVPPHLSKAGELPDAYRVWLSEIMLQQTTVAAVKTYFNDFTTRWPQIEDLAAADSADVMAAWAGLGYYARARNLLKTAVIISWERQGKFPESNAELRELPGIGPYTAAAISSIAFGQSEVVMDGNVERVMARFYAENDPLPAVKKRLYERAAAATPKARAGDYAQSVMDLGATICTPRNPQCSNCPLRSGCLAHAQGLTDVLPRKSPKPEKPTRRGIVYIATRADGAMLLERRPAKGLLGGMLGWPGAEWCEEPVATPPFAGNWQKMPTVVRHTFTHFHLLLDVWVVKPLAGDVPECGAFILQQDFRVSDLPTVMRKAYDATLLPAQTV